MEQEKSALVLDQHVGGPQRASATAQQKQKKVRGRPSESDKKELKAMIPNMTNEEAKHLVEYYKNKYIEQPAEKT